MPNRATKIFLLFGLYLALHFVSACGIDCDCNPIEFPYFDYGKINLTHNTDPVSDGKLTLTLEMDSIRYLADATPCRPHFGFLSGAYACSCASDGERGDKFNITVLEIFADQDFDDTFPAGTPLNGLFSIHIGYAWPKPLQSSLPASFGYEGAFIYLETPAKPKDSGLPYRFTIQITKSNGTTFTLQTAEIHF